MKTKWKDKCGCSHLALFLSQLTSVICFWFNVVHVSVLQGPAEALRKDVQSGSMSLKDKLSIELHPDNRIGAVRYGADLFNTKV